jgi:hypothetical protein
MRGNRRRLYSRRQHLPDSATRRCGTPPYLWVQSVKPRGLCGRPPVSTANCSTPSVTQQRRAMHCIAAQRTSKRPTHGHKQIRSRLSAFACHGIGGCSFCLIDIPCRMDDDRFGQGGRWIPQVRYAVTAGPGARRLVPHQVPARRVHGAPPSPPPQFASLTELGTVRSSQGPPGARHLVTTFRATRGGHASRRSSNLTRCKA